MTMKVHILYEYGPDGPGPFGSSYLRLLRPLTHPQLQQTFQVTVGQTYDNQPVKAVIVDRLWRPDVSPAKAAVLVEQVHRHGAKLIYALDDNLLQLADKGKDWQITPDQVWVIEYFLRQADGVLVTTKTLKEQLISYNPNIVVLPHALDERLWPDKPRSFSPDNSGKKIIGYMGTPTHDDDLKMILPALQAVCHRHPEVEFQVVGVTGSADTIKMMGDLPLTIVEPKFYEYPKFIAWWTTLSWDIALSPLQDTVFNRCKSDIKFLDYCALGAAGIYSRVPAYENSVGHLQTGWLAENNVKAWEEALETLLDDSVLRTELARNGHNYLCNERTLAHCAPRWAEALDVLLNQSPQQRIDNLLKQREILRQESPLSQFGLRIDLGCGSAKKEGTLGVDIHPGPGVDYVLNIETDLLPFADGAVSYVHSSHFLEHTTNAGAIFKEISRVCADRAKLELWTPHAWSNSSFVLGHTTFFTEDIYLHMCVWYTDFWTKAFKARWILNEFQYVVTPKTLSYLHQKQVDLDFALRHLQNVAQEFCAHITLLRHDLSAASPPLKRTFSTHRFGPRYEIRTTQAFEGPESNMEEAIRAFAQGESLPPLS